MSHKVFADKVFPRHVSDIMNLMHMMIFNGTDGEEHWETFLTLKQKEYVALGLAEYYQCDHCITHHLKAVSRLEEFGKNKLENNILSMVLFLRIDSRSVSPREHQQWIEAWDRFADKISFLTGDKALPHLMGLAIGIARDDRFLIDFCGKEVCSILSSQGVEPRAAIGELEAVVIFMKAAASKNRVVDKIEELLHDQDLTS